MAEITFLHDYGDGDDESPYWSHDFDTHLDLQPSDPNLDLDLDLGLGLDLGFSTHNFGPEDDDDDVDDHTYNFTSPDCAIHNSFLPEIAFSDPDDEIEETEEIEEVGIGLNSVFENGPDSFQLDDDDTIENGKDFEWEEVDESVFLGADVDDDMAMEYELGIDQVSSLEWDDDVDERVFFGADVDDDVAMEHEPGTDQVSNLEWEILLNIHNLDSNVDDDDVYDEYEMLVGMELRKPPASSAAVESLKIVVMTKDDVDGEDVLCAICKDEMCVGEKVKMLPCFHRYHGCCIDPWLGIGNTCPVCRFELPTDDPEYERRRVERGGRA